MARAAAKGDGKNGDCEQHRMPSSIHIDEGEHEDDNH
eukprot:CAMPEP_0118923664 /NCGR_PEP_ID=MMETSP1169-20130426/2105_1 /TAXON_ID=36882 /ORGANISM="Pyramimonas obovata, Strain CCMP722" /LENGTH=36 /DNA_ID= /DNA_START= /DNA_END= /DNA_ORIENTATION=